MIYLQITVILLLLCILILSVKIYLIKKSLREAEYSLKEKLNGDTNTLISLSSRDRDVRKFGSSLNMELSKLDIQRQRYLSGDRELKTAVTNISHDLRTPLTAICGYLDLLEDEPKSDTAQEYLEVIRGRTERMKKLTQELFSFSVTVSQEKDITLSDTDIRSVLEESIAQSYALMKEKGIKPKITMPEERVILPSDRNALSRIFENIISNAVKYGNEGIEITLTREGKITFANPAPGLSRVQAERLFDRFYTVEEGRSSTGIGLSIAKSLTEKTGGKIYAEYENDRLEIVIEL